MMKSAYILCDFSVVACADAGDFKAAINLIRVGKVKEILKLDFSSYD